MACPSAQKAFCHFYSLLSVKPSTQAATTRVLSRVVLPMPAWVLSIFHYLSKSIQMALLSLRVHVIMAWYTGYILGDGEGQELPDGYAHVMSSVSPTRLPGISLAIP
jgi:hypothetical protein